MSHQFSMVAGRVRLLVLSVVCGLLAGTDAHAGIMQWTNGFEGVEANGWWVAGNAGVDRGLGLAYAGANNGWVRNWQGWNAVNTWVSTYPGVPCTVQARIRSSSTLTAGYMTIRSGRDSHIIRQIGIPGVGSRDYQTYSFSFTSDSYTALFYVGLWGNGSDSWMQVDDVVVSCAY